MIALYLDHQIYSFFKQKDDPSKFKGEEGERKRETVNKLYDFLTMQKSNFLIFYSHAHLLDLSSDKSGDKERLLNDLECRSKWAEDNYLVFNEKENRSNYQLAFPEEEFGPYWEQQTDIDFSNLFDLSGLEGFVDNEKMEELRKQKSLLENFKLPNLDDLVSEETKQNEDYDKIKEMLGFINGGTFMDIVKGFTDFTNRFQEEKGFYKGMRNLISTGIQKSKTAINPHSASIESKFMFDLANIDLNGLEKEKFIENNLLAFVKKQWADRNKGKEPTIFDLHYQSYIMLDMMGIEKEKATIARNMLHDAQHSFYGGHCEVVVSDDKQFRAKSKLLYKLFGLSTQVLSMEEFMSQSFSMKLEDINSSSDLLLRAKHDLNTSLISSSNITPIFNQIMAIRPSMKYLHYFNEIFIVNEDGQSSLVFRHKVETYLKHLLYKIVQEITNKTVLLFGLDTDNKGLYRWEKENDEILEGKWLGRNWKLGESILMLQISPERNYLQLIIA